jgi:hypothetical protein
MSAAPGAPARRRRRIGPVGTAGRLVIAAWFLGGVIIGHIHAVNPAPILLGLFGFPAIVLAWHWWRVRRNPRPFEYTSPLAFGLNALIFFALWLTWWYAPALRITSDATLVFYGMSMLVAALYGYDGCEVLAISNWILRRDDQVGCALFIGVDYLEARWRARHPEAARAPSERAG